MKKLLKILSLTLSTLLSVFTIQHSSADVVGYTVNSPGSPGSTIVIDATLDLMVEWNGADHIQLDYGMGAPLTADIYALHKADGIYLGISVQDSGFNNSDSIIIYFDINHSHGGSNEATDWGVEINRSGQANWGAANVDPGSWVAVPAANFEVLPGSPWTAEFYLPTGAPSNLVISSADVGVYFSVFNADLAFSDNSAKYTQWPIPPVLNDLNDDIPDEWGNYDFDPTSTFPDIEVVNVRRGGAGSENYYKISHTETNTFEVQLDNPGGTAIPDATNVRVNLYLAAIGIGEPWHRLDQESVIEADCTNFTDVTWPSNNLAKNKVCSGSNSLGDISGETINDVVDNIAEYTVKNGSPMNRLGGESITVSAVTDSYYDILEWNTTSSQDDFFKQVTVDSTTYNRQHQCMKAEAIVPNDPDEGNNSRQRNMDFVCIPGGQAFSFLFSLGWAGFGEYQFDQGKAMFLQVSKRNMPAEMGWGYQLNNVEQIGDDIFKAFIKGRKSTPVKLELKAPVEDPFGRSLKENLMVPPRAGGILPKAAKKSGEKPVYVKVNRGSTLWVINYDFNDTDEQWVDTDGQGTKPKNGPRGYKAIEHPSSLLLSSADPGALIGSFDNFKSAFLIGEGVKVKVPSYATHLALAINDEVGHYDNNTGTGFRVKVSQQTHSVVSNESLFSPFISSVVAAEQSTVEAVSILDLLPLICVNGYEQTSNAKLLGGNKHELYRFVGRVCLNVINVYPRDRGKKPDVGDPGPGNDDGGGIPPGQGDNGEQPDLPWIIIVILILIFILWWFMRSRKS